MKVKKFVAPSMPEAMKKVRSELGKDAVILNSKVIQTGGIFGLFTKKNIEVIAAIDPEPVPANTPVQNKIQPKKTEQAKKASQQYVGQETGKLNGANEELLKEVKELKSLMRDVSKREPTQVEHYPEPINKINALLIDQEINQDMRRDLLSSLLEKWYMNKGQAHFDEVKQWLKDDMMERLSGLDFGPVDYSKSYLNVIGPTGVGKTTTLAKLAAHSVLKYQKKVAFITTDTYRIAAIEQLKTYAEILDVPLEVAYNIEDFKQAKEKFAEYDLVLIDTAGRNFRNQEYVKDLKLVIDFDEEIETFLVLALTSKHSDMEAIVTQFSNIPIHKFIFTKVDETSKYGSMLNLMLKYQIGAGYLTIGQNVPDDIIEASPDIIINNLFGVDDYDGSS